MYDREKEKDELINLLIEALQNELDDMFLESLDNPVWDNPNTEYETPESSTDQLDFEIR